MSARTNERIKLAHHMAKSAPLLNVRSLLNAGHHCVPIEKKTGSPPPSWHHCSSVERTHFCPGNRIGVERNAVQHNSRSSCLCSLGYETRVMRGAKNILGYLAWSQKLNVNFKCEKNYWHFIHFRSDGQERLNFSASHFNHSNGKTSAEFFQPHVARGRNIKTSSLTDSLQIAPGL